MHAPKTKHILEIGQIENRPIPDIIFSELSCPKLNQFFQLIKTLNFENIFLFEFLSLKPYIFCFFIAPSISFKNDGKN